MPWPTPSPRLWPAPSSPPSGPPSTNSPPTDPEPTLTEGTPTTIRAIGAAKSTAGARPTAITSRPVRHPDLVLPFAHNYAREGPVVEAADAALDGGRLWRLNSWVELIDRQ